MVAWKFKLARPSRCMAIGLLLASAAARAETPAASSKAPAETIPADFAGGDWTTPLKATASYYVALAKADGMGLNQSVAWADPDDGRRIAVAMVWIGWDKQLRELYTAMARAYPGDKDVEAYVKKNLADLDAGAARQAEESARIAKELTEGEVKIDGETATVKARGHDPMTLKKAGGQWRILPQTLEAPYNNITAELRKEMIKDAASAQKLRDARTLAYEKFILELPLKKYPTGAVAIEARSMVDLEVARKVAEEK